MTWSVICVATACALMRVILLLSLCRQILIEGHVTNLKNAMDMVRLLTVYSVKTSITTALLYTWLFNKPISTKHMHTYVYIFSLFTGFYYVYCIIFQALWGRHRYNLSFSSQQSASRWASSLRIFMMLKVWQAAVIWFRITYSSAIVHLLMQSVFSIPCACT